MPTGPGSIRLFKFAGIQVFLHWSWFLVAMYEMNARSSTYSSFVWNGIEYVALFGIVTMHEFGHALACRQVGGRAERIVLWPLGGVAYVDPPPRPSATLWSIAAGPLVNVALLPVFGSLLLLGSYAGIAQFSPDLNALLQALMFINVVLLLFNILPIYPLDGGQILRSLLWFAIGRAQSLLVASVIGFVGVAALGLLAFAVGSLWIGVLALFAGLQCLMGFAHARMLKAPRREGHTCPACRKAAPKGAFWVCGSCRRLYDPFESARWAPQAFGESSSIGLNLSVQDQQPSSTTGQPKCPRCRTLSAELKCPECGAAHTYQDWQLAAAKPVESERFKSAQPAGTPSVAPIVFGVISALIAVPALMAALLFWKASSEAIALEPAFQQEINFLWAAEGIPIPGAASMALLSDYPYDAYVEASTSDAGGVVLDDIAVVNPTTGEQMHVEFREAGEAEVFRREGRELRPKASFSVPKDGRYSIHTITSGESFPNARVKIGTSATRLNGSGGPLYRGIAIGASVVSFVLAIGAFLSFRHYYRRRRTFAESRIPDFTP
jgi:Zn-dependent protease